MTPLVALALSIGALGGIATAIYLKTGLAIWAGFIAWACFFHSGGDSEALKKTIIGNLFGIFCAAVAAVLLLGSVGASLGGAAAPVIVGVTVFVMVLGAHLKPFSTIPASVYGYAATFAAILMADASGRGRRPHGRRDHREPGHQGCDLHDRWRPLRDRLGEAGRSTDQEGLTFRRARWQGHTRAPGSSRGLCVSHAPVHARSPSHCLTATSPASGPGPGSRS